MPDVAATIVPTPWTPGERARVRQPHRQLMAAVLQTAVDDYRDSFHPRSAAYGTLGARRRCQQARIYVLSRDRVWPFSFENVCDALDLDASTLRRAVLRPPGASTTGPVTVEELIDRAARALASAG